MNLMHTTKITVRVLIFVLLLGLVASCGGYFDNREPEPGTDLYAVSSSQISEVLFSSEQKKIYAFRWNTAEKFIIMVASPGISAVEQCTAGKGFERWLNAVSSLRVGKEVKNAAINPAGTISAVLRLRDTSEVESIEIRLQIPSAGNELALISAGEKQFSVEVDTAIVRTVLAGCRVLAAS